MSFGLKDLTFYFRKIFRREVSESDASLPLKLKRRMLEAELDRLDADIRMLTERRDVVRSEMRRCKHILDARRRGPLRRVK